MIILGLLGGVWFDSLFYTSGIGTGCGLLFGLVMKLAVRWEIRGANKTLREELRRELHQQIQDKFGQLPTQQHNTNEPAGPATNAESAINVAGPIDAAANHAQTASAPADAMAARRPDPRSASGSVQSGPKVTELTTCMTVSTTQDSLESAPLKMDVKAASSTAAAPAGSVDMAAIGQRYDAVHRWLTDGNVIACAGLGILFIGLSFLASYAAAAGLFPIEFRLALIGLAGIGLLTIGFKKRIARPGLALLLQGGGVAVLYLTAFAACRLFAVIAPLQSFALMLLMCALGCTLALLQNAKSLAVTAFIGGFAVPLLLTTGSGGSSVALFGYYTMLNLAILIITCKRSWRALNLIGFIATFGVGTSWGILKFESALYLSSQCFLTIFVMIFLATAVMNARHPQTVAGRHADSALLFGTPLLGFGLQAGLVTQFELGTALSALGFAAIYLLLAIGLSRSGRAGYRSLTECLIVIGIGFLTLAVPLALDARWTSGVWSLEACAAFWVGMRQNRWIPRAFGLIMQPVAALIFLNGIEANVFPWPFVNPRFLGAMFVALPAFLIAWWLRDPLPHSGSDRACRYGSVESRMAGPAFFSGFFFWCIALVLEVHRHVPAAYSDAGSVAAVSIPIQGVLSALAVVVSAWILAQMSRRCRWPIALWPGRFTLVILGFGLVQEINGELHILKTSSWIIWLAALILHYHLLYQNDQDNDKHRQATDVVDVAGGVSLFKLYRATHAGGAWLIMLLSADCLRFLIGLGNLWASSWGAAVSTVSATIALWWLAAWGGNAKRAASLASSRWPRNPHAVAYYCHAAAPMAVLVFANALVISLIDTGLPQPLPYVPLLNPTDVSIALAIAGLMFWRRTIVRMDPVPPGGGWVQHKSTLYALIGLAFIGLNTVWLRITHHYFGVNWDQTALFSSFAAQTGCAILWTLLAMSVMVIGHRRSQRELWIAGAGLLAVVVIKLLVIDLSNAAGLERIIAFIAVGLLMLVVGYFSPLPPNRKNPAVDAAGLLTRAVHSPTSSSQAVTGKSSS